MESTLHLFIILRVTVESVLNEMDITLINFIIIMCVIVKFVNKGIYPYMYMYFILLETVKEKEAEDNKLCCVLESE